MTSERVPPLAPRHGVNPSCVVLPPGPWNTIAEFLPHRFPGVAAHIWAQRMEDGDVLMEGGQRLTAHSLYRAGLRVYYYRAVENEPAIPFQEEVLWQNEHLLVVDKPHFLPVIPSGKYLQETLLVRLKNRLGLQNLSPIHRIDRDTAGLVLFSVNPASRGAYHALFRERQVNKTYACIAPWNPDLPWPVRRESRIVPDTHFMQQREVEGPPNALTEIVPEEQSGGLARYRLKPVTGQRHQLRVHMAALGLPIVNDGIYPTLTPEGACDYSKPLQLLARAIEFIDPIGGRALRFASQFELQALEALGHYTVQS